MCEWGQPIDDMHGVHQISIGCVPLMPSTVFAFELPYNIMIKSYKFWHDGIGGIAILIYN